MGLVVRIREHLHRPRVSARPAAHLYGDALYDELGPLQDGVAGHDPVGELHLLLAEVRHLAHQDDHRVHLLHVVLGEFVDDRVHDAGDH